MGELEGAAGPVGLGLLQLQAQERPMSSQEQALATLASRRACPGHVLCTRPALRTSAAPTNCECSLGCEMLVSSQLPLNIALHKVAPENRMAPWGD